MLAAAEQPVVKDSPKATKEIEKKWGTALLKAGWTAVPNMIFLRQQALGLDSLDLNILLVLLSHWWSADNLPFPSKKTIAETVGIDESTVRKRIKSLEAGGLIKRIERRQDKDRSQTNLYDFTGLIEAATGYANEEVAAREEQRANKAARSKRKGKPLLKVVDGKA